MLTRFKTFLRQLMFNYWYFRNPPWDTNISPPELMAFIQAHPAGSALDLGCGTGTNVITLAQHGWDVTGVDFALRAIQTGRRKVELAGVQARLLHGDVTRLDHVQGPFDLILDIGCLHGVLPDLRPAYFANLERLLAPGGTYLLYAFWNETSADGQTGLWESDLAALQEHLELVQRQDGTERGRRPSSWLTFERASATETA
jgi:SAM-dependent methyltransferase